MNKPPTGTGDHSPFEVVIGLEVHCQMLTASKLFCSCPTTYGAGPNQNVCQVCLGHPGVLPVLNHAAVDHAVRMALAVGARVNEVSVFARKQYFYPDLPKGYQITQYDLPYCTGGSVKLASGKQVRLTRIHIEEDAGKNVHGGEGSLVDVNRAGIPLMEIVSEPDLASADEAAEYLKQLRGLARHLGVSDGNMEEGSFRCDANVSLRRKGETKLGTRCEIKNLNSFKNIERAINYEIERQGDVLAGGGKIQQQTLHFDPDTGRTSAMRSKEDSHDYRYFPDPDLKPLRLSRERIDSLRATLPELPEAMAARFVSELQLSDYDAAVLTSDKDLAAYFDTAVKAAAGKAPAKLVANWVSSELLREVNEKGWEIARAPVTAGHLGELAALIGDGTISGKIAKTLFAKMVEAAGSGSGSGSVPRPAALVDQLGLRQVQDDGAILAVVRQVIGENPSQAAQYKGGNTKLLGFFVGKIMKQDGKLNPAKVNALLQEELERT